MGATTLGKLPSAKFLALCAFVLLESSVLIRLFIPTGRVTPAPVCAATHLWDAASWPTCGDAEASLPHAMVIMGTAAMQHQSAPPVPRAPAQQPPVLLPAPAPAEVLDPQPAAARAEPLEVAEAPMPAHAHAAAEKVEAAPATHSTPEPEPTEEEPASAAPPQPVVATRPEPEPPVIDSSLANQAPHTRTLHTALWKSALWELVGGGAPPAGAFNPDVQCSVFEALLGTGSCLAHEQHAEQAAAAADSPASAGAAAALTANIDWFAALSVACYGMLAAAVATAAYVVLSQQPPVPEREYVPGAAAAAALLHHAPPSSLQHSHHHRHHMRADLMSVVTVECTPEVAPLPLDLSPVLPCSGSVHHSSARAHTVPSSADVDDSPAPAGSAGQSSHSGSVFGALFSAGARRASGQPSAAHAAAAAAYALADDADDGGAAGPSAAAAEATPAVSADSDSFYGSGGGPSAIPATKATAHKLPTPLESLASGARAAGAALTGTRSRQHRGAAAAAEEGEDGRELSESFGFAVAEQQDPEEDGRRTAARRGRTGAAAARAAGAAATAVLGTAQRMTRSMMKTGERLTGRPDAETDADHARHVRVGDVDNVHEAHIQRMAALRSRQQGF
ncbi:hypothetical protein FOA52_014553 [Chlamydomonas sp. UWO 241]|nr:hypothetical protein FOA52_014553 [Chlamydomonas sp. UWO 241]